MSQFDAMILTGGKSSRLGGQEKATMRLGGERLVDRVAAAALAVGANRLITVGPEHAAPAGSVVVREDPPFTGPLAAIAAGLELVHEEWVMILPCDLARPDALCLALTDAWQSGRESEGEGVLLRDSLGHRQWLAGIYASDALRAACAALGDRLTDLPVRRAFGMRGCEKRPLTTLFRLILTARRICCGLRQR
ncbi:molybdenum cofactor guanylyltransferase [Leucobacter sp. Z1108]|uniref:molybdenum cofactor guanylyltransferase n=1 Tax=unclassified Leucobacter TaxID=2621730 RepID=UPI003D99A8E5